MRATDVLKAGGSALGMCMGLDMCSDHLDVSLFFFYKSHSFKNKISVVSTHTFQSLSLFCNHTY